MELLSTDEYKWVWDLYPLSPDSWGDREIRISHQIVEFVPGTAIELRRKWDAHDGIWQYFQPRELANYSSLKGPIEKRRYYYPIERDYERLILREGVTYHDRPPWPLIEAELLAHGFKRGVLVKSSAVTLLKMLENPQAYEEYSAVEAGRLQHESHSEQKSATDEAGMESKVKEQDDPESQGIGPGDDSMRDGSGFVIKPADPTAYVSFTRIMKSHCPTEIAVTDRQLRQILNSKCKSIRQYRPRSNRRSVHLVDWECYCTLKEGQDESGMTEEQIEARIAEASHKKRGCK